VINVEILWKISVKELVRPTVSQTVTELAVSRFGVRLVPDPTTVFVLVRDVVEKSALKGGALGGARATNTLVVHEAHAAADCKSLASCDSADLSDADRPYRARIARRLEPPGVRAAHAEDLRQLLATLDAARLTFAAQRGISTYIAGQLPTSIVGAAPAALGSWF